MNINGINTIFSKNYIYKNLQSPISNTVSFVGFKKAPTILQGKIVEPQDRFKTNDKVVYTFINSTIKTSKKKKEDDAQYIYGRIINAENCNIQRYIYSPEVNLKNTTTIQIIAGNVNMLNSNSEFVDLKSQTVAHANIFNSYIGCLTLYTNDPIKYGRNLLDNELTINNSTIKQIRYPETLPSQNNFYILNHSKIDNINFYNIIHKQAFYISDSSVNKLIDSRLAISTVNLHNATIGQLRCNPKYLQMSGNNEIGDIIFSCYYCNPGENIEIKIPKGTKINGDIIFEQTKHIPGINYIINVEEGAQLNGNVFVFKTKKYHNNYSIQQPECIEDKSANLIINRNVKLQK